MYQDLPVSGIQRSQSGDPGLESRWAAPVTRGGEPSPARCGPVTSSRWRGGERKGAPATQPDWHLPTLSDLRHAQYRLLFRLAVFLTGDADAAEPWCWIALPPGPHPEQVAAACRVALATLLLAPPGRGQFSATGRLAFRPLSTSRTATGSVHRSARPAASAADPLFLPGHQPVPGPDLD